MSRYGGVGQGRFRNDRAMENGSMQNQRPPGLINDGPPISGMSRIREQFPSQRRRYSPGYLTAATLEVLRANSEMYIAVDSIIVANTSASLAKFTIQHVPKNKTVTAEFGIFSSIPVRPESSVIVSDVPIYLNPGDSLHASATAASALVLTIYARTY